LTHTLQTCVKYAARTKVKWEFNVHPFGAVVKRTALALILISAVLLANIVATSLVHFERGITIYAELVGAADDWPMFRHDPQRSGYSTSTAPNTNEVKWFYNTTIEIDSAPAVANGRVIVGVSNGDVLALNSTTGEKLWSFETGAGSNSIWCSPAIDSGRVYIGTRDRNLYCLNETTGTLLWTYLTGDEVDSSPLVSDGKVFFGSYDGKLYCLNANDGSYIWSYQTGRDIYASPAILGDVVFACSYNGVHAFNASTGVKVWDFNVTGGFSSSPAISGERIFVASSSGSVYCLSTTNGALLWDKLVGGTFIRSSPAVSNGRVFIGGGYDGVVYCLDATTGVSIWQFTSQSLAGIWSSPAVADGKVFVGTETPGIVYCLDESTGIDIWSFRGLERVASSPAISDGTVFVGCGSGVLGVGGLYAFGARYSLPTSLSLFLNSQTALLGFKVNLNGTLESNGTPIEGASIVLSYSVTGGQTWNDITSVQTSADGSYSAVWQPSATGTYLVKAHWTPYYPYEVAESTRMLSVNTFDEQNVFSVVSNSTVSALAFNSTSKELSFTLSGPDGTVGFVDVTLAKSLVANSADLRVYLDGVSLNY
jgi:outer membrane protein assembly factor BamB